MKSTTVVVFCSLLLLAVACQLSHSRVPKGFHHKTFSLGHAVSSSRSATSSVDLVTTCAGSVASFIQFAVGWSAVPLNIIEVTIQTLLTLFGFSFLSWTVPIVIRCTAAMLLAVAFGLSETMASYAMLPVHAGYAMIRAQLIKRIPFFELLEQLGSSAYNAPSTISNAINSTSQAMHGSVLYAASAFDTMRNFTAAAAKMASTFVNETVTELTKPSNWTSSLNGASEFNMTENFMHFQRGTVTILPPPHLMGQVTLVDNPIQLTDELEPIIPKGSFVNPKENASYYASPLFEEDE